MLSPPPQLQMPVSCGEKGKACSLSKHNSWLHGEWYENGPGGFLDMVILTSYLELVIILSSSFAHLMTGAGSPRALHRS